MTVERIERVLKDIIRKYPRVTEIERGEPTLNPPYDDTDVIELEERREIVRNVQIGFPPESGNFTDAHKPIKPFGTMWGRGVIFKDSEGYFAKIGGYDTSHANLKTGAGDASVVKTIYFGFADGTLYLDHASVAANVPFNQDILIATATALSEQPGSPLRGSVYRIKQ